MGVDARIRCASTTCLTLQSLCGQLGGTCVRVRAQDSGAAGFPWENAREISTTPAYARSNRGPHTSRRHVVDLGPTSVTQLRDPKPRGQVWCSCEPRRDRPSTARDVGAEIVRVWPSCPDGVVGDVDSRSIVPGAHGARSSRPRRIRPSTVFSMFGSSHRGGTDRTVRQVSVRLEEPA